MLKVKMTHMHTYGATGVFKSVIVQHTNLETQILTLHYFAQILLIQGSWLGLQCGNYGQGVQRR